MDIRVIGDSAGTLAPESLRPDRPRRRRPPPTGQVGSAPPEIGAVRRNPNCKPRSRPSWASGRTSSKGCNQLNFGNPSQRGNPVGDPEGHESPSDANFGRILQPEPRIPWWNEIPGNSGRVAGGRLGSDEMGLGLRWRVSIEGSTGKMRKASGVSSLYQNRRGKTPPRFRRFAATPQRRDFTVAGPGGGNKAGD